MKGIGQPMFGTLANAWIACIVIPIACLSIGCSTGKVPKVAVVQNKPQEWADALKLGFSEGLRELGVEDGEDVIIVPRTAGGDPVVLSSIVATVIRGDYAMIYSLGTQASQEVLNKSKSQPIIFGAVTDPVEAGLYDGDLQHPLGNITGTQDLWPYPAQFDLIQTLVPGVERIGIVYNSSEANSQVSVRYIRAECEKRGMQLEERTVTSESEIQIAVSAILSKAVDAFFIPADNTAQTSSPVIIALCDGENIPVFTGIPGIVESGAVGTVGTNYFELGKVNARQAFEVLQGRAQPRVIDVAIAGRGDIHLNLTAAEERGILVPDSLIEKAFRVYR